MNINDDLGLGTNYVHTNMNINNDDLGLAASSSDNIVNSYNTFDISEYNNSASEIEYSLSNNLMNSEHYKNKNNIENKLYSNIYMTKPRDKLLSCLNNSKRRLKMILHVEKWKT